ncbi:MAG: ABC transporter permease [Planctomycetota bacterium]
MSFVEALRIALLDLSLHKFRAALATLGIIFGVASVESMIAIGEGAKRESLSRIEALGVNNILVRSVKPAETGGSSAASNKRTRVLEYGLLRSDLAHVQRSFPFIRQAVGLRDMRENMYTRSARKLDIAISATEPEYLALTRSRIGRGRFLTWLDLADYKRVAVVGSAAARKIFGYEDPIGRVVRVSTHWFRVVGILENDFSAKNSGGAELASCVFIPLTTAHMLFGDLSATLASGSMERVIVQLDNILLEVGDTDAVIPTARRVEAYLDKTHKKKDYAISVPMELMLQKAEAQRIFSIVTASIAGISLLVGGIGIMNIMLANVTERRKEIGTRRALGARRGDILLQFVFESATLTSLGGFAGAAAGFAIARAVSAYADWPTVVTFWSVALGVGISCLVGILFGLWPAYQAARVHPIEALRSE